MGRKLDLGTLTEEEEKVILDVINRDYDLRRVETERIGKLSKDVESEEVHQQEIVKEAVQEELPIDTLCARCGSKFIWLINPKGKCNGCDLYFCRNKVKCIVYDKLTQQCFCNACLKQRDLQSFSGEWFYSKLKGKFRRHGGAKVKRELNKKSRNKKNDDPSNPPEKPKRIGLNDDYTMSPTSSPGSTPSTLRRQRPKDGYSAHPLDVEESSSLVEEIVAPAKEIQPNQNGISQEYDVEMDAVVIETSSNVLESAPQVAEHNHIEIQTDDLEMEDRVQKSSSPAAIEHSDIEIQTEETFIEPSEEEKLPTIKEELEEAIVKLLLPKLEELRKDQAKQVSGTERDQKVEDAVKLAEEMIDKALERAKEKHVAFPQSEHSNRSSLREAGTMTETSDSEMDSVSSHSGRGSKKSRQSIPLSERLGSLSPDSLRKTLSQGSSGNSSITQGVVLQKDQLVARADMDHAFAEILDQQGVRVHDNNQPQEFSTELTFTAVGSQNRHIPSRGSSSSEHSYSDDEDKHHSAILGEDCNWVTPEVKPVPSHLKNNMPGNTNSSNSLMSIENGVKSPYEHLGEVDSDSDDREHVDEGEILASIVKRPNDSVSAVSLASHEVEVVETLTQEKKAHLPVNVAVDPLIIESLSEDINQNKVNRKEVDTPDTPPIEEVTIEAVDRQAQFQESPQIIEVEHEEFVEEKPSSARSSIDHDKQTSEEESSDSESEDSEHKTRISTILQPERMSTVAHEQAPVRKHLDSDRELMADDDEFGDKMAEVMAQNAARYEPVQQEVTVDISITTREEETIDPSTISMSSMSENDESDHESQTSEDSDDGAPTPTRDLDYHDESAVALRIINSKSIEVLADAIQNIEEVKGRKSDSDSESSKTYSGKSTPRSPHEIHQLNEAEEKIYANAARTFAIHDRVDLLEEETSKLSQHERDLPKLRRLEMEVKQAEREVEEINHGGNSIDEILRRLRGAGLQVEKGNFKRTSLDSASGMEKPKRYSLPAASPSSDLKPVNASTGNPFLRHTFTVIPASRTQNIVLRDPKHDLTEKTRPFSRKDFSSIKPIEKVSVRSLSRSSSSSSDDEATKSQKNAFKDLELELELSEITPAIQRTEEAATEFIPAKDVKSESYSSISSRSTTKEEMEDMNEVYASKTTITLKSPEDPQTPLIPVLKDDSVHSSTISRSSSNSSIHSDDDESPSYVSGLPIEIEQSPRPVPRIRKEIVQEERKIVTSTPIAKERSKEDEHPHAVEQEMVAAPLRVTQEYSEAPRSESGSEYDGPIDSHSESESEKHMPSRMIKPRSPSLTSESESESEVIESEARPAMRETALILAAEKSDKSSSDSESDDEKLEPRPVLRKASPVLIRQESSSESESEEETLELGPALRKTPPVPIKEKSSSESESEEEILEPTQVLRKSSPVLIKEKSSSESESEEETLAARMKIQRSDAVHSDSGSDSDEETQDVSHGSKRSTFGDLTAAEQREMARIALMLPETVIAQDQPETRTRSFVVVGRSDVEEKVTSGHEAAIKAHYGTKDVTEVHSDHESTDSEHEEVTSGHSDNQDAHQSHNEVVITTHIQHEEVTPVQHHPEEVTPVQSQYEIIEAEVHHHEDVVTNKTHIEEVTEVHTETEEVTSVQMRHKEVTTGQESNDENRLSIIEIKQQQLLAKMKDSSPYKVHKYEKKENGWKGTTFNTDKEKSKLRHSLDGSMTWKEENTGETSRHSMSELEAPSDHERTAAGRGSITIRGGKKMVMTTSPEKQKPEFQAIQE